MASCRITMRLKNLNMQPIIWLTLPSLAEISNSSCYQHLAAPTISRWNLYVPQMKPTTKRETSKRTFVFINYMQLSKASKHTHKRTLFVEQLSTTLNKRHCTRYEHFKNDSFSLTNTKSPPHTPGRIGEENQPQTVVRVPHLQREGRPISNGPDILMVQSTQYILANADFFMCILLHIVNAQQKWLFSSIKSKNENMKFCLYFKTRFNVANNFSMQKSENSQSISGRFQPEEIHTCASLVQFWLRRRHAWNLQTPAEFRSSSTRRQVSQPTDEEKTPAYVALSTSHNTKVTVIDQIYMHKFFFFICMHMQERTRAQCRMLNHWLVPNIVSYKIRKTPHKQTGKLHHNVKRIRHNSDGKHRH